MDDPGDWPKLAKQEKKIVLSMLREMWLNGDSPLRRIYSSWEELETNLEIKSETASQEEHTINPCPNCGAKQKIIMPFEGIFPYQTCKSCKNPFYVNKDLTVRKLSKEERRELPEAWIQVVEDMNRKKVAVVFGLE
jgi:RNase P subunit RPR2